MSDAQGQDPREMYEEISALVGGLGRAFDLDESRVITALELQEITMTFDVDANGNRFALATYRGRAARLYAGAIKHDTLDPPK